MKTTTTTASSARATSVVEIPGASHFVLEDRPRELRDSILDALLAAEGAIAATDARARCPETLGIRPLAQFASMEEAMKQLAPRSLPTPQQVEAALAEASVDDEVPDDELEAARGGDGGGGAHRRTALIQNDPEYFGFVG